MKDFATAKQRTSVFSFKKKLKLDILQDIAFIKRSIKQWKNEREIKMISKHLYGLRELRGTK